MKSEKRLMILGASRAQLVAIEHAKSRNCYVIACDMNPESVGKNYVDEFHVISTIDLDAILQVAKESKIDGIMTYAADAAAPTVAYVGNKLGLPSNPYESVRIMARKDLFRIFLQNNGFYVPISDVYKDWHEAKNDLKKFNFPLIVKPCDSAGSRGVTKIEDDNISDDDFKNVFNKALSFSRAKNVVVEDFIQRHQYQVAGDGFVVDGRLVFRCFANEHFNRSCNTLVPIGESFPLIYKAEKHDESHKVLQAIFSKLDIQFGAFNFDFMITHKGDIFVIEIGPRNGGNLIPQVTKYATGVDMVDYTIRAALGEDCSDLKMVETTGYYASYMIHTKRSGIYKEIKISDELRSNVLEHNIYIEPGTAVEAFHSAGCAFGDMILKFANKDEMLEKMDHMDKYLEVILEDGKC